MNTELAGASGELGVALSIPFVGLFTYRDNEVASVEEDLEYGDVVEIDAYMHATTPSTTRADGVVLPNDTAFRYSGSCWNHVIKLHTDEGVPNAVTDADWGFFGLVYDQTPVDRNDPTFPAAPFQYNTDVRVALWGAHLDAFVLGSTDAALAKGDGIPVRDRLSGLAGVSQAIDDERVSLDSSPLAASLTNRPRGVAIASEAFAVDGLTKVLFNGWRGFHLY